MIGLTKVELRRLFSRRLTFIAVLGALALTGLMLFAAFDQAKPLSGEQLAIQQAGFEQAQKEWKVSGQQQVKDCLTMQADMQKSDPKATAFCDQRMMRWLIANAGECGFEVVGDRLMAFCRRMDVQALHVLLATMNSDVSGFNFRSVSAMWVPSMLLTKWTLRSRLP